MVAASESPCNPLLSERGADSRGERARSGAGRAEFDYNWARFQNGRACLGRISSWI
jgi:hypothetical protein